MSSTQFLATIPPSRTSAHASSLAGTALDGASVYQLLEDHRCTFSAAVPTVWLGLLQHLESTGSKLTTLQRACVGGAACPPSLIAAFQDKYGVEIRHMWGA